MEMIYVAIQLAWFATFRDRFSLCVSFKKMVPLAPLVCTHGLTRVC